MSARTVNTMVDNCLTVSIGMSGKSGRSGRPFCRQNSLSQKQCSSETVLLKQYCSNSVSSTSETGTSRMSGMSGRPFVERTSSFRNKSSETVLLKQFFFSVGGRCVMAGCQTQTEFEPLRSRLFIHFGYIRVLRLSLNADQ